MKGTYVYCVDRRPRRPPAADARPARAAGAWARYGCSTSSAACSLVVADAPLDGTARRRSTGPDRSRLGVARGGRARSGRRIVHRRDRGAADEAVHDLHERRRALAHVRSRAARDRRRREARREPSGVGRARGARSRARSRGAAPKKKAPTAPIGAAYLARKKAQRDAASSWRRTRARRWRRCTIDWPRDRVWRSGGRRASCRCRAAVAARRGVSGAARARGVVPGARRARIASARAPGLRLTFSGPWPPYTFVQD